MKAQILGLSFTALAVSLATAQVTPISPQSVGLIPKTATFDVNTNFNNTSTESLGVGIAANGNVLAAWEDDGSGISDTENIYSLFSSTGSLLTPPITITDYMGNTLADVTYRAFFRDNGTPTPGNVSWGPKVHANFFGNGYGIGGNAFVNDTPFLYGMGFEIPRFADIQVDDAGNGAGDFPAVQLLNNDGTPAALALSGVTDANSEPAGSIRIGDWEYLSNSNIVIVGESRQADDRALTGQTGGNVIVFRIVTPAGVEVKGYTAVSSEALGADMWHGVGVTSNGFAVRFSSGGIKIRMFDNNGNPTTTNIDLSALTGQNQGGNRGDASGFHGNGKDAYVNINSVNNTPWVTVLNADGTLRYSRAVADSGDPNPASDRVDAAISADGRVIAVWDDNEDWTGGGTAFRLPQGRIFSKTGSGSGGIFWISERDNSTNGLAEARRPRAAWRGDNVAIVWESKNSPVSVDNVVSVRLFSPPPPPEPKTIIVNTEDNTDFGTGKTNLVTAINLLGDGDTIKFNIPGTAGQIHYLQTPTTGYPIITNDNVTVDGYSQPGASPNSNPIHAANNAKLKICLDSRNGHGTSMGQITNYIVVPSRPGYGEDEWAVLGVFGGTNVHIKGLSILSSPLGDDGMGNTGDIKSLSFARSHVRSCANWHVSGCWIGVDPATGQVAYLSDGTTVATPAIAFAAYRHRDISGGPLPDVYCQPGTIGVAAGSSDPRAEFNVIVTGYGFDSEGLNYRISGNFWGVLPDGVTSADMSVLNGGNQLGDGFIEIGRNTSNLTIGTDGDGNNDADEGNVFGGFANGGAVMMDLYSDPRTNIVVAGNWFGVGVDGTTVFTNAATLVDTFGPQSTVQFGSDFDGVSDALEANVIYNNNPFATLYPDPSTSSEPRSFLFNTGARMSFRGNKTVNNDLIPFDYADGAGGQLNNFTNYEAPFMSTSGDIIPVLNPTNIYPTLSGTFAVGVAPYTNITIDVYQLDQQGWNNGKLFGLSELITPDGSTNGFPQGAKYLGSFPVANTGSFSVNLTGLDLGAGAVTVTANYSADPAGAHNGRTQTSNFSNPVTLIPGSAASVGITRTVPDVLLWYNSAGYYTNGPVDPAAQLANLGNWEPYISNLGDTTFLVGANTFADDQNPPAGAVISASAPFQRFVVTLQPAAGGTPKIGEEFYTDAGDPYRGVINYRRENGNPQRVAGDKRLGAVNFLTAAETSLGQNSAFQSDTRWTTNPCYNADNAYVTVQPFSLNVATLGQTPLHKAFDPIYGNFVTNAPPVTQPQVSRTGGTAACLDNGNFVMVSDDRTGYLDPDSELTSFSIITPTGTVVKSATLVDLNDIWSNVAAYKGGFAIRVHNLIYFYDNAGNLQGSVDQSTSGLTFDTGRGDGTRIASDIRSFYVYLAGDAGAHTPVNVAIWDSRTRSFVASATVSDTDPALHSVDRVALAVDALDRFCVAYMIKPTPDFLQFQVAARVMKFDGTQVTSLTHSFFSFVNYDPNGSSGLTTVTPSVAMTTRQICIAAKGTVNSTNNPASGANTAPETTLYTVISHPDPQPTPGGENIVITSISAAGQAVTITWTGGAGPYLLQRKFNLTDATWQNVMTTPDKSAVVALQGSAAFFRVCDGVTNTVTQLTAFLSGDAERPGNASTATGLGSFSLEGNTLNYYITFSGLSANASAAHIHGPTNTTASTGVIIPFSPPPATSGVISGSTNVSDLFKGYLLSGLTYANIHDTPNFGGGEIRGQIGPTQLKASLNGANEKPPVAPAGTGSATLTRIGNQLLFNITYSGLTSAANNAHIHGRTDVLDPAGVLVALPTPTGTSGTLSGTLTLNNATLSAIVDGVSYVNIHTANNPGGEIRGTITP